MARRGLCYYPIHHPIIDTLGARHEIQLGPLHRSPPHGQRQVALLRSRRAAPVGGRYGFRVRRADLAPCTSASTTASLANYGKLSRPDKTIRERLERLYGWQVAAEEIVFLPGVVIGFNMACHARRAGRRRAGPAAGLLSLSGRAGQRGHTRNMPRCTAPAASYELDMTAFEQAITERTQAVYPLQPAQPHRPRLRARRTRPWPRSACATTC